MADLDNSWQQRFAAKVCTAEQAVRKLPPGRRMLIGSGAAEPGQLVEAMVAHAHQLADNEIVHLLTLGPAPYVEPGMQSRFRHTAFFIGANVRQAVQEGRAASSARGCEIRQCRGDTPDLGAPPVREANA